MGSEETAKRKAELDPASVSQPAKKRVRSSYDDILTMIVGGGKLTRTFKVHKDLIASRSTYFKSATAPERWLEGKENTVKLAGYHPRNFETYIECLYNPEADLFAIVGEAVKFHVASLSNEPNFAQHKALWTRGFTLKWLAELWVLGDYLGDANFKNRVMEKLDANLQLIYVMAKETQYIVDNTVPTSGLYRWLVEQYHAKLVTPMLSTIKDGIVETMPPALCKDVLKLFATRSKESDKVAKLDREAFFEKEGTA